VHQKRIIEKIKTHILCLKTSFRKWCHFLDDVENYCTAWQVRDYNILRYSLTGQRWQYITVQPDRPEMTIYYGTAREARDDNILRLMRLARCIKKAIRTHKHTYTMWNNYCFLTATMLAPTLLNVTFIHKLISCFIITNSTHKMNIVTYMIIMQQNM
jgi:hypothetical protein